MPICEKGGCKMLHSDDTPSIGRHYFCDRCYGHSSEGHLFGSTRCWRCPDCDFDLCFQCHPEDEHDLNRDQLNRCVLAAQRQAELRFQEQQEIFPETSGEESSRSVSPEALQDADDDELNRSVRAAQRQAGLRLKEQQEVAAKLSGKESSRPVSPENLLGNWVDCYGNDVFVISTDAIRARLIAKLSQPFRPDIQLNLRPVSAGGGWRCGNTVLDQEGSSERQLIWLFPNGRVSVWSRPHWSTSPAASTTASTAVSKPGSTGNLTPDASTAGSGDEGVVMVPVLLPVSAK